MTPDRETSMKMNTLAVYLSAGVALASLSFGASNCGAIAATTTVQINGDFFAQSSPFQNIRWEEEKREKLRHAYWLLEHANADYGGHKTEAMKSIKKAAGILDFDLAWHGEHAHEDQWNSDRRVREAKHILEDLQDETHGGEQEHIHHAVHELDKALARH